MVSEDFTFPELPTPIPQGGTPSSLWRVPSLVYPDHHLFDGEANKVANITTRKSFSFPSDARLTEEKMDKLWEDFNDKDEEILRLSGFLYKKSSLSDINYIRCVYPDGHQRSFSDGRVTTSYPVRVFCVKANEEPKVGTGTINPPRRNGIFRIVKLIKKIMMLSNVSWTFKLSKLSNVSGIQK